MSSIIPNSEPICAVDSITGVDDFDFGDFPWNDLSDEDILSQANISLHSTSNSHLLGVSAMPSSPPLPQLPQTQAQSPQLFSITSDWRSSTPVPLAELSSDLLPTLASLGLPQSHPLSSPSRSTPPPPSTNRTGCVQPTSPTPRAPRTPKPLSRYFQADSTPPAGAPTSLPPPPPSPLRLRSTGTPEPPSLPLSEPEPVSMRKKPYRIEKSGRSGKANVTSSAARTAGLLSWVNSEVSQFVGKDHETVRQEQTKAKKGIVNRVKSMGKK